MQHKTEVFGEVVIKPISLLQKLLVRRICYCIVIIIIIVINSRPNLFFYELRPKNFCVHTYLKFVGYISNIRFVTMFVIF